MTTETSRTPRGFTLVELMSALAVSSIVLLALAGTVIAQSRAFELNARTREAISGGRRSLGFIDAKLRLAGYGVHPALAFSFAAQRDFVDQPDQLMIRHRDPFFRREGTVAVAGGVVGNTLTLSDGLPDGGLRAGEVLMLICRDGSRAAYVTVAADAAAEATVISLAPYAGTDAVLNFPNVQPSGCLLGQDAGNRPWVARVDELRFHVSGDALMLNRNGVDVPVAVGVEDFQVAYLMNRPAPGWFDPAVEPAAPDTAGDSNWAYGDVLGTVESPNVQAVAPALGDEYRHANRFTAHPANIRAVRITLVTRSDREYAANERRPAAENRPAAQATDGFYRNVLTRQINVPNLMSRALFAPVNAISQGGS